MANEGIRRRKTPRLYEVLIVPVGEGGKTSKFIASRAKLILLGLLFFFISVLATLAVLIYTPVALYVPIPNPILEQRYGRQIVDTQTRLDKLADEVMVLRDYNTQLRKALGDEGNKDSASTGASVPTVSLSRGEHPQTAAEESAQSTSSAIDASADLDQPTDAMPMGLSVVNTAIEASRANLPLVTPVQGFLSQGFDPSRRHFGLDIAAKSGTPVYAATDGHVVFAGWTFDDGNMLIISHGGGYLTVYKHNQSLLIQAQSVVKRGEPIALLGSSGRTSLGPHLHFEVWNNGVPQDPNEYLLSPIHAQ